MLRRFVQPQRTLTVAGSGRPVAGAGVPQYGSQDSATLGTTHGRRWRRVSADRSRCGHSPADRSSIDKNINAREAARERNLWCWHHHKGRMLFCGGRDGCNFANGPLAGC
jgi:hypothetical protein